MCVPQQRYRWVIERDLFAGSLMILFRFPSGTELKLIVYKNVSLGKELNKIGISITLNFKSVIEIPVCQ